MSEILKKKNEENQRRSELKRVQAPSKFIYFIFCLGILVANVFAEKGAPVGGIKIESVEPSKVYVSVSGQQNSATLRGANLEKIYAVKVFLHDKPVPQILGQVAPMNGSTRNVFFVAAPKAELSDEYKVYGITKDKQIFPIKMELEIVKADDERGNPVPIEEMTKGKGDFAKGVISVDINQAPVVMKTIPEPFAIKSDGQPQHVVLKGRNLDKVTEIRLRRADKKKYIGDSGKIPFKLHGKDIELDLSATSDTPAGSKYCLDLIMGRFIAGTLTFETFSDAPQPLLKSPQADAPVAVEVPEQKAAAEPPPSADLPATAAAEAQNTNAHSPPEEAPSYIDSRAP